MVARQLKQLHFLAWFTHCWPVERALESFLRKTQQKVSAPLGYHARHFPQTYPRNNISTLRNGRQPLCERLACLQTYYSVCILGLQINTEPEFLVS